MPLYEILCISAHATKYSEIHELVKQTALTVLNNGGVVRSLNSWGTKALPVRMRSSSSNYHTVGDYWTMRFDASPKVMTTVGKQLREHNQVLRATTLKLGDRLQEITTYKERTVYWSDTPKGA